MPEARVADFKHLLDALGSGCPPHAGLAIGFDRFMALLCNVESVRDVIAFPKNSKGTDLMVGSPRRVDASELRRYHLQGIPNETGAENTESGEAGA
jgi:aspartyl-tRNA synthetase